MKESAGFLSLRVWARAAAERAQRLFFQTGAVPDIREACDSSIAELSELVRLLDHDEALRATTTVWLGNALATRCCSGNGTQEDRERAKRLLRAARDPSTPTGAATRVEDKRWAALALAGLLTPWPPMGASPDQASFSAVLDQGAMSPEEALATAAEIQALLVDIRELPLPAQLHSRLQQMGAMLAAVSEGPGGVGAMREYAESFPEGTPYRDEMRLMTDLLVTAAGSAAPSESTAPAESTARPEPTADTTAATGPQPTPRPEPTVPHQGQAHASFQATDEDLIAVDALVASILDALKALRSADPEVLSQILGRLRAAHERLPPGHEAVTMVEHTISMVLQAAASIGGNRQDTSRGRTYAKALISQLESLAAQSTTAVTAEFTLSVRLYPLMSQVAEAYDAQDVTALRALLAELEALEADTPQDNWFRFQILLTLAQVCVSLGRLSHESDMLLRGATYLERGLVDAERAPAAFRETHPSIATGADALRAHVTGNPEFLKDLAPAPPDAPSGQRWDAVLALQVRYRLTRDPADLDTIIVELRRISHGIRQGERPAFAAKALWQLAEAYWVRWLDMRDPADQAAATVTATEALHQLAADVVLQLGSEDGLSAARSGAQRGVTAAFWAASHNKAEEAVAALELGRALVLKAASTSRTVPELLEARGHQELAAAWRSAQTPQELTSDGPPGELLSSLRRRALEALGYRQRGLFTTPTLHELADGVLESGADALVYLIPGEGEAPGVGIIVTPDVGVGVGGLPLLSGTGSGPLDHYLDAAAHRSGHLGEPAAEQAWEEALSALCDWAYHAVFDDVLRAVAKQVDARGKRRAGHAGPPRIVLVACGRLGVVPWHAARLPAKAPHEYVCQTAVISYAASGSQFLRTVRRARRDPAAAAVLVADPRQELTRAEQEATALYEACYPRARLWGEFYEAPADPEATGTPAELLALLDESPSLVHVASHGSAGVRPTVSALHLAFPDGTDALPTEQGGPGAQPDLGMLTVTRLLDHPENQHDAADGPLIVLSACETDLSTRDHDEALTLTTAFAASGARDVVGSRWTTQDGASALMMAVFHHYLAIAGNSPADALRAAQLWMLDPRRENPGSLSGELLREMARPDLDRLPVWAAFIHQGHPGPEDQQDLGMGRRTS